MCPMQILIQVVLTLPADLKMVQSVVKRHADPQMILGLWNACAALKQQKQTATAEKIQNFMHRLHVV